MAGTWYEGALEGLENAVGATPTEATLGLLGAAGTAVALFFGAPPLLLGAVAAVFAGMAVFVAEGQAPRGLSAAALARVAVVGALLGGSLGGFMAVSTSTVVIPGLVGANAFFLGAGTGGDLGREEASAATARTQASEDAATEKRIAAELASRHPAPAAPAPAASSASAAGPAPAAPAPAPPPEPLGTREGIAHELHELYGD